MGYERWTWAVLIRRERTQRARCRRPRSAPPDAFTYRDLHGQTAQALSEHVAVYHALPTAAQLDAAAARQATPISPPLVTARGSVESAIMADAFAPHLLGRLHDLARTPEQHAAMVALAAPSLLSDATTPEAQLLHRAGYIGAVHPDAAGGDHMALLTREVGAVLARAAAAGALTGAQTHRWLTGAHVLAEHVATHDRAPTKAELHAGIKKLTAAARLPG